jgi:hypothetical protein
MPLKCCEALLLLSLKCVGFASVTYAAGTEHEVAAYTAWLADSMQRIMPNATNTEGLGVPLTASSELSHLAAELDVAGNEFESIQIALRGGDRNCSLSVEFDGRLPDGLSLRAQQVRSWACPMPDIHVRT